MDGLRPVFGRWFVSLHDHNYPNCSKNAQACGIIIYMKIKTVDLSKTLKGYSNRWVALDPTSMKVVASAKETENILEKAKKAGVKHPVLTKVPQHYGTYIL